MKMFIAFLWLISLAAVSQLAIHETKEMYEDTHMTVEELALIADPLPESGERSPLDDVCCMSAIDDLVGELMYVQSELDECKSKLILTEDIK